MHKITLALANSDTAQTAWMYVNLPCFREARHHGGPNHSTATTISGKISSNTPHNFNQMSM